MKRVIIFYVMIMLPVVVMGQDKPVTDVAVTGVLKLHDNDQNNLMDDSNDSQKGLAALGTAMQTQVDTMRTILVRLYNAKTKAQEVVKNLYDVAYAFEIIEQISDYQKQVYSYAQGDAELLLMAAILEKQVVERITMLSTQITLALTGGSKNMLDNKQRDNLIKNAVKELKYIRGIMYGVRREIKSASTAKKFKNPKPLQLTDNRKQIAQELIKEFKQ
ncbi:hypothetical protein [Persicobacter diffluens]